MLNFEQKVELGKRLKIWSVNPSELKAIDLMKEGLPAAYIYEPIRGGRQIIVGNDYKVLSFASSLTLEKAIQDIKHNKLWEKAVEIEAL